MAEQLPDTYYRTPFKFNGKELDEETGLYYYGARYYDPKISIWLSVDPLVEAFPNWNPYNYTMQNPINLVDPTGMSAEPPTDIYKVWKNNDGTYRADKWQHIADGKNDQIYLMMGDNGVATAMYQGAAAQNDMYSDGIKLDHIDYGNGNTVNNVLSASKDFWTSDEYRTRNARETIVGYIGAVVPFEGLFLGMLGNAAKSGLSFSKGVLENFTKHAFAGSRHADLGLSVETMASKGMNLVESNMHLLKAGDNTLIGNINGIQKSFKAFVQDGKIMSVNMYPGVSNRVTQGTTINFGNVTW